MITAKLPTPKISDAFAITITTPDLDDSVQFYSKLGFTELFRSIFPFPLVQISDGSLVIMLRKEDSPYLALSYYVKDPVQTAEELEYKGIYFISKPRPNDLIKRYLFQSPDGLNISLVSRVDTFRKPTGPGMLSMKETDYYNPDCYVNKTCGMFGELAHPVKDVKRSISWWAKLGFKVMTESPSPYPSAILTDGLVIIGLHQTSLFPHPALTFFAVDMQEKIEGLETKGITGIGIGGANRVLKTPEGQHINLFSLGI